MLCQPNCVYRAGGRLHARNTQPKPVANNKIMIKLTYSCVRRSKGKGKAVPLQAWTGTEDSRKLRFPDFVTTAQDGGKVVSLTHRPPLPPGKTPGTHF